MSERRPSACRRRVVVALAAAASVVGCGGSGTNSPTPTPRAQAASTSSSATATSTPTPSPGGTAAPGQVLAQQTAKVPNSRNATVDIAVLGLTVHGRLENLSVRFTPHFPDKSPGDSISLYDMSDNALDTDQVSLVDPVGLKRYLVVKDANNVALGSFEVTTRAVNNSPVIARYTFAAPPASVTKLDVDLGPFPPFDDVPITR